MNDNDLFEITLKFAGLKFKATIPRNQEEIYRRAAEEVDKVYNFFLEKYGSDITREELLMAVSLDFALKKTKILNKFTNFVAKVEEVNDELEEFLNQ